MRFRPRYPVYCISKGRADVCLTARFLLRDRVPFKLVVEPQERDLYANNLAGADIWRCECGCGASIAMGVEVDHFFGRAKAGESLETCWALTPTCHYRKTHNHPDAKHWLEKFIAHAEKHGYAKELERTRTRLAWVTARASFTRARA